MDGSTLYSEDLFSSVLITDHATGIQLEVRGIGRFWHVVLDLVPGVRAG